MTPSEQSDTPECPECGEPMHREYRITIGGRTPWRCPNRHLAVDEAEVARKAGCGYLEIGGSRS